MRYKITLSYDGTNYKGWDPGIKNVLKEAIYKYQQIDVKLYVAGRTDAGVHALNQVCHFDSPKVLSGCGERALNFYLPKDIIVKKVERVDEDFHARFSAKKRYYSYFFSQEKNIFNKNFWYIQKPVDFGVLKELLALLEGYHDFSSFVPGGFTGRVYRTLEKAYLREHEDNLGYKYYSLNFESKSFMHHQIRYMAAALLYVSIGIIKEKDFISKFKNKEKFPLCAIPNALFLVKIDY
jgi:tRNA pseudouridine38-40 synthase